MPPDFDYPAHNRHMQKTWDTFNAGAPIKPPVVLGISPEWMLCNRDVNPDAIPMRTYLTSESVRPRNSVDK